MNELLVHFFARCDHDLNLQTIFWHEPIYLISPNQTNLKDLFFETDLRQLKALVLSAKGDHKILFSLEHLPLRNPNLDIAIYIMATEKSLFVFGIDTRFLLDEAKGSDLKAIISQFMHVIRSTSDEHISENQQVIRSQFEHIQKLNNDLVNTQRQLKKANAQLNRLNEDLNNRLVKDQLTGLVSRYQYRDEMDRMIRQAPNELGLFAFIDIDNFKSVNDTYGHGVGDIYLQTFASRLQSLPFENMICIRIAGDEFGLYIHPYRLETSMDDLWRHLLEVLNEPLIIDAHSLPFRCCAGFAIYNLDSKNIYELIDYADFAMYQAKESGKFSYQAFDAELYRTNKLLLNSSKVHDKP